MFAQDAPYRLVGRSLAALYASETPLAMLKSVKAFVLQPFVNKFASQFRLITPSADKKMAVIRNTSSARRVGRVGNTTYYVSNGQQIARQSRNDSNYGVDASRTIAQQMRRVKWSNLVNIYKACKYWMPKAFESKKTSQSDYNKFMSLNINTSSVCLTKDQALGGCAVMASYIVSQGSLVPINYAGEDTQGTNVITSLTLNENSFEGLTAGDVAAGIVSANVGFLPGDNIAMILFKTSEPKPNMPYTSTTYTEFTLDISSEIDFADTNFGTMLTLVNKKLAVKSSLFGENLYQCVALIHTRKVNGKLLTSTQQAYPNITDWWDKYSTQDQEEAAIASYGVQEDVPLDPSFKLGSIISISVDDVVSPFIKGRIVSHPGACSLTVVGDNLTADNYELRFDDTVYTPLVEDGNSKTYILSTNGTARIYINGVLFGGVRITGVVVPSELSLLRKIALVATKESYIGYGLYKYEGDVLCVNFAHTVQQGYPYFRFIVGSDGTELVGSDFGYSNCVQESGQYWEESEYYSMVLSVVDSAKPAHVTYKGIIIAVFNY